VADLLALTVRQPWAELLADGTKPVENRTWAPPRHLRQPRLRLAVHAGVAWGAPEKHAAESLRLADYELSTSPVLGAVVAVATLLGFVEGSGGAAIERVTVFDPRREQDLHSIIESVAFARFFTGPTGWVLGDVVRLRNPVLCRGAQGIWPLTYGLAEDVLREEEASRAA
jgi:hypothetical protein